MKLKLFCLTLPLFCIAFALFLFWLSGEPLVRGPDLAFTVGLSAIASAFVSAHTYIFFKD